MSDHDEIWIAGYKFGRNDGITHLMMLLNIAMDYYPNKLPESANGIVSDQDSKALTELVKNFADSCRRAGAREEKERAGKRALKNTETKQETA